MKKHAYAPFCLQPRDLSIISAFRHGRALAAKMALGHHVADFELGLVHRINLTLLASRCPPHKGNPEIAFGFPDEKLRALSYRNYSVTDYIVLSEAAMEAGAKSARLRELVLRQFETLARNEGLCPFTREELFERAVTDAAMEFRLFAHVFDRVFAKIYIPVFSKRYAAMFAKEDPVTGNRRPLRESGVPARAVIGHRIDTVMTGEAAAVQDQPSSFYGVMGYLCAGEEVMRCRLSEAGSRKMCSDDVFYENPFYDLAEEHERRMKRAELRLAGE